MSSMQLQPLLLWVNVVSQSTLFAHCSLRGRACGQGLLNQIFAEHSVPFPYQTVTMAVWVVETTLATVMARMVLQSLPQGCH